MSLLSLKNIYFSVGEFPLLDNVDLDIDTHCKIALIGRNGEGKSTLFKIMSGVLSPDGGEVIKSSTVRVSRLIQEMPLHSDKTVFEFISEGLKELSQLLIQYHHLTQQENHDDKWMQDLTECQQKIDHLDGWTIQQRIDTIVDALSLPNDKKMSELSGGWRRRVALGQALVQEPDILLLDEPTNHLDLKAIKWLEDFILNYEKTIIFITHDRALLRKCATDILELDRGRLTFYPPDYDNYIERKTKNLLDEQKHQKEFDKKLSNEEAWIRQGVKARRTRNEGRVRALMRLRDERQKRRVISNKPQFVANQAFQTGKDVIVAESISFGFDKEHLLLDNFSFTIQRGDKIAIVGPNGVGKTTLVKLLLGELPIISGNLKHSPKNQIAFFERTRDQLKLEETVASNVTEGDDFLTIDGKQKHVIGYLGDFLFSPEKCLSLAKVLSGGEQNRLLLAKLFSKPANVLVLDEPTNDLDIESLEVLEDLLLNYEGTVIIISHDREFIDNIATHTIGFTEKGKFSINVGGYTDWLQREAELKKMAQTPKSSSVPKKSESVSTPQNKNSAKKLSFNEQRELESLPLKIEKLEAQIREIQAKMGQPEFHQQTPAQMQEARKLLSELDSELELAFSRWELLDK